MSADCTEHQVIIRLPAGGLQHARSTVRESPTGILQTYPEVCVFGNRIVLLVRPSSWDPVDARVWSGQADERPRLSFRWETFPPPPMDLRSVQSGREFAPSRAHALDIEITETPAAGTFVTRWLGPDLFDGETVIDEVEAGWQLRSGSATDSGSTVSRPGRRTLSRYGALSADLQDRIIALVGNGRLGTQCALDLLMVGVRRFVLIDSDSFDSSNLDGTPLPESALGEPKPFALASLLSSLRRGVGTTPVPHPIESVEALNALSICDAIVCTPDRADARWLTDRVAQHLGVPCAHAASGATGASAGAEVRLLGPGQGCLACSGGLPEDPAEQQPGLSPRVTNAIAASIAADRLAHALCHRVSRRPVAGVRVLSDPFGRRSTLSSLPVANMCPQCSHWRRLHG